MNNQKSGESEATPLDAAARAAWLNYVGGMTQDQIARELGISRQRVQRLISRAVAEGLIHIRLEHRISSCLAQEKALTDRYDLKLARVAPSLGDGRDPLASVAPVAAAELERILKRTAPVVLALGTGRFLRAAIEEMQRIDGSQHRVVSLNGNIAPDGSASFFDVTMRMADKTQARHYPMPLPVFAASTEERAVLHGLAPVQRARQIARAAEVSFVGIGQVSDSAPVVKDGFLSTAEIADLRSKGAAGEITGWVYDDSGQVLDHEVHNRVAGVRPEQAGEKLVVAVAAGHEKLRALRAAISGNLINALITDEDTASELLA